MRSKAPKTKTETPMTEAQERVGYEILANKRLVVGFVRPEVTDEVVEKFQEEFAKGRDQDWAWVVHPTRSYSEGAWLSVGTGKR